MNSYDRSMSNNYDGGPMRSPMGGGPFERQMSVPANLVEHSYDKPNGYGMQGGGRMGMGGGGGGDSYFHHGGGFGGNRSMSPGRGGGMGGFSEMKIGTWNEGTSNDGNRGGRGENGGSSNNFPNVGNFEIGTFNISSPSSGNHHGNEFNSHHHGNNTGPPQAGLGIRETGIIEKLLVRTKSKNI